MKEEERGEERPKKKKKLLKLRKILILSFLAAKTKRKIQSFIQSKPINLCF